MSLSDLPSRGPEQLVLAICTCRRPNGLLKLLNRVSELKGRDRVTVLVVDNDPDRGAEPVVKNFNAQSDLGVVYMHATPQGIATARNVALDYGGARGLPILFIDDDAVPDPQWLASMLSTHKRFPSAIIAGPVRPEFGGPLPSWAPDGYFWRRPEHGDGEFLQAPVAGGNALLPAKLTVGGLRFDTELDLMGGEDGHLMLRWLRANEEIVWSAGASVVEHIPVERLSLGYARDRAYFASIAYQHVIQKIEDPPRLKTLARIARRWTFAVFSWSFGVLRSSPQMAAKASLHAAAARGTWAGMRGRQSNRWVKYQIDV